LAVGRSHLDLEEKRAACIQRGVALQDERSAVSSVAGMQISLAEKVDVKATILVGGIALWEGCSCV